MHSSLLWACRSAIRKQYDYARRDHYDHLRFEQERRHEEWVRAHEFGRYHDGYRGRR